MPYLDLTGIGNKHLASNSRRPSKLKLRLNLRGLMLLLLSADDQEKVNCILKNLSKADNDVELKRDLNGLLYTVKENFPFLSIYFERFLEVTHTFVFNRLKEIANEIKDRLDKISLEELKYIVTRKFYTKIESRVWNNTTGRLGISRTLALPGVVPKEVCLYKLSILYYLRTNIEDDLFLIDIMIDDNKYDLANCNCVFQSG